MPTLRSYIDRAAQSLERSNVPNSDTLYADTVYSAYEMQQRESSRNAIMEAYRQQAARQAAIQYDNSIYTQISSDTMRGWAVSSSVHQAPPGDIEDVISFAESIRHPGGVMLTANQLKDLALAAKLWLNHSKENDLPTMEINYKEL